MTVNQHPETQQEKEYLYIEFVAGLYLKYLNYRIHTEKVVNQWNIYKKLLLSLKGKMENC